MKYEKLKHSRFIVNLFVKTFKNYPKFLSITRRANHYFSYKISKNFDIDHKDLALKLSNLSIESYIYQNFRNNKTLIYFLIRKSNAPLKKFFFKLFIFNFFFRLGLRKNYSSIILIYDFLVSNYCFVQNKDNACYFFNLPKPVTNLGKLNLKETVFEAVLKDTNCEKTIFDVSLKSSRQIRNKWLNFYSINIKSKIIFLLEAIFTLITYNLISLKKTKRYKFLMMEEIFKAIAIKRCINIKLNIHFFNFVSQGSYKPIWLKYSEEKFKTRSSFIWDSISTFPQVSSKYDLMSFNITKMQWENEYVMSKNHKLFLSKLRDNKNITYKIPKNSDLFSNKAEISMKKKSYIVVFPLTPQSLYYNLGTASLHDIYGIFLAEYMIKFTKDIVDICMKYNCNVVIKNKRMSYANEKLYQKYLDKVSVNKKICVIKGKVGIEELIKNSIGCLSFPITSTAVIAAKLNVPSAYYSVNKIFYKSNIEFMNNELLVTKKDLDCWIKNLV